jgi:3-methylcrotonyl-CoA carboxylase alpha subunit
MIKKLLIANRGEIALRIMRSAKAMGIRTVAVFSAADARALHVEVADEAVSIGGALARESYLDMRAILWAAKRTGADAIHPGYGFLSENPDFAEAVARAGLTFIGPPASAMRAMGLKGEAKRLMRKAGVPVVPGYEREDQSDARLAAEARAIGFPLLVKPVAGGGGRGMRIVAAEEDFGLALAAARREAAASFGDDRVLLEKHLSPVRHVEVQVMADTHGNVIHLWERDCSAQRRHQKVIEEAPAPGLSDGLRQAMCEAAVNAARRVGYVGVGTVEFLVPGGGKDFFFIEMNTRLQVEHPVTEMITSLDLVEMQLRIAAGERMQEGELPVTGHAVEARLYAEDPRDGFRPQTGRITALEVPGFVRFDTGVRAGDVVTAHYDAMIGKLIAHAPTRAEAVAKLSAALEATHVGGVSTNLGFLARLVKHEAVAAGRLDTGLIDRALPELTDVREPPDIVRAALRGFRLWEGFRVRRRALRDLWLEEGGHVHHLRVYGNEVVFDGERYEVARQKPVSRGPDAGGSRVVSAPVPGLLARWMVGNGANVKAGDVVAVVEAMKTEFLLRAGAEGAIRFLIAEGTQVREGATVAEIDG